MDKRNAIGTEREPLFVHANLAMRISGTQEKSYDLKVFDVSEKGVGLLVSEEQSHLLERTGIGDKLKGVELYFSLTVPGARGGETRVSTGSLFENVKNVVPQNMAFSLDQRVFR
jgi:hypothetical protein